MCPLHFQCSAATILHQMQARDRNTRRGTGRRDTKRDAERSGVKVNRKKDKKARFGEEKEEACVRRHPNPTRE